MTPEDPRRDADDDLREALQRAVADVEPSYRLDRIRTRTRSDPRSGSPEEGPMKKNARTWLVGATGAVIATAAVIVTLAVVGGGDDDTAPTAGDPTSSASPSERPSETASSAPRPTPPASSAPEPGPSQGAETGDGGGVEVVVPVYYTVDTPQGARLVREFRRVGAAGDSAEDRATAALDAAVGLAPADPDYTTGWPSDASVEVVRRSDDWLVTVASAETDLRAVPDGTDPGTAEAMRQQLVYTLQAVLQERPPIELVASDGGEGGPLLGGTSGPVEAADELDALALMNITNPVEGQVVRGDTLRADGRSSGFEATVVWEVRAGGADGEVVEEGSATAEGWMDALYPWSFDVDVADLEPGDYTLVVRNDDPTGGTEGIGDSADTKAFTLE